MEQEEDTMAEKLVCLDPGHGPGSVNASPDGTLREAEVTLCYDRGTPRGCGRELLRRVIQEVFRSTDAEKIVYRVRSNNTASIRLIESLGGVLQEPASVAESLLMRRYWVERDGFEKNQHDVERE